MAMTSAGGHRERGKGMATYEVTFKVTEVAVIEIEADNEEQMREIFYANAIECWQNSRSIEDNIEIEDYRKV